MTKHLPYLMEKYGIMPWHLGGPEHLTTKELQAILEHYEKAIQSERRQASAGRPSRPARKR